MANDREAIGGNKPPPNADPMREKLERENKEFLDTAADLELKSFKLPELVNTDEDAQAVADFVALAKRFAKTVEDRRVAEKDPYLTASRSVDAFFGEIRNPVEAKITMLSGRVGAYQRAKAERERADRLERERLAREEQARAEQARIDAEEASKRAAAEAEAAAASMRSASADAEERAAAETRMREAEQTRLEQGRVAEEQAAAAAEAERIAEQSRRAAAGKVGQLAKVTTSGGASVGATTFWNHEVTNEADLVASLGVLGPYFTDDAIRAAVAAAKREAIRLGTVAELGIPGVRFFEDTRTNIRATK